MLQLSNATEQQSVQLAAETAVVIAIGGRDGSHSTHVRGEG